MARNNVAVRKFQTERCLERPPATRYVPFREHEKSRRYVVEVCLPDGFGNLNTRPSEYKTAISLFHLNMQVGMKRGAVQ